MLVAFIYYVFLANMRYMLSYTLHNNYYYYPCCIPGRRRCGLPGATASSYSAPALAAGCYYSPPRRLEARVRAQQAQRLRVDDPLSNNAVARRCLRQNGAGEAQHREAAICQLLRRPDTAAFSAPPR